MNPSEPFASFKTNSWLLLWNCSNRESFFGTPGTKTYHFNVSTIYCIFEVCRLLSLLFFNNSVHTSLFMDCSGFVGF